MPSNASPTLYIVLYEMGDLPESEPDHPLPAGMFGFHWALIPVPHTLTIADRLVEYTILKIPNTESWKTDHRMIRRVTLDPHFHVCVKLPPILGGLRINDFIDLIMEQPPGQDDTPHLDLQVNWSSAQWCIRILRSLVDVDLIHLPLATDEDCALFHRRISSIGTAAGITNVPYTFVKDVKVVDYQ